MITITDNAILIMPSSMVPTVSSSDFFIDTKKENNIKSH